MMSPSALPQFFSVISNRLIECGDEVRRVFHGRGRCYDGLEQITADWLGQGVLQIAVFKEAEPAFYIALNEQVQAFVQSDVWKQVGGKTVSVQHRDREGAETETLVGEMPMQINVVENTLTYKLDLGKRQNNGLFLDMRLGRQWVKDHAQGKRVLNLFAYTCGFSVAAIEGGAEKVVNLDMAKSSLSRGRENHQLNQHDMSKVSFLGHELFKSWGKVKKFGPYDLVIIDPPSFQKGSFVLTKDYAKILRKLPELVAEGGDVLACVNSPDVLPSFLTEQMAELAPAFLFESRLENPPEFEDIDTDSALKVLHFKHS
ncbi:class I SAM-dependent methyltransferase [Enterovibrio nigricans]|uniref:23S rRNA (Cytosine1962-C5)-methyltransferase n=1 Tax=Enterovibrio nigricans DSM 22720 TaxID=1121868 RepID=A0A1T4UWP0_9GAMM|nr:class I SAM-dependent methyltransferase [Enterovibrio nigricans]SKA57112.1 23S rRNA (cytosine1962-C5)-methyltransferase [Enterovibrio nigricans DSM 22720]